MQPANGEIEVLQAPTLPISACTEEQIKQPIRYAFTVAGLKAKNYPVDAEKLVMINFLRRNYPDYTPGEIAFAFDKAMARRLPDLDNPSCFENFSCEYLGKILSAYEKWKGDDNVLVRELYGMVHFDLASRDKAREAAQDWFDKFQRGEHIDFISGSVYWILQLDQFIAAIPQKRQYPRFLKVMAFFEHAVNRGYPYLYTQDPVKAEPPTLQLFYNDDAGGTAGEPPVNVDELDF